MCTRVNCRNSFETKCFAKTRKDIGNVFKRKIEVDTIGLETQNDMEMLRNDIQIVLFEERHQPEVELLLESIGEEFPEPISTKNTNKTTLSPDLYLVAVIENRVVGTISITRLEKDNAVLKKMFLHRNCRGQGVAALLLLNVLNWAKGKGINAVYLGTMSQFKAAQKFYEKHHFTMIDVEQLPRDFPINPIDSIFYKLNLIHSNQSIKEN